jgi:hypothetical protein
MFEEIFDIIFVRWVNLFLIIGGIGYAYTIIRKLATIYIGIPILVWLLQAFFFYFIFFLYHYGIIIIPIITAERLFSYWSTFSKLFSLITMYLYLYYIQRSCWRGNSI